MTERVFIPCPICTNTTKNYNGVLGCFSCGVKFDGLPEEKWYVATNDVVLALEAKIKSLEGQLANVTEFVDRGYKAAMFGLEAQVSSLKTRLEQVSNRHLFSVIRPDFKMLSQDITDEMSQAYYAAGENPDDAWRAMWKAADEDLYVNPTSNTLLKRCIEIAWERGFGKAINSTFVHNAERTIPAIELGAVIHIAFEELQRENPDLFKDLVPEQFSE